MKDKLNGFDGYYTMLMERYANQNGFPNFISVICATCGWNPMETDETILISFDNERYQIKRLK